MTTEIKVYEQLTTIQTFDGQIMTEMTIEDMMKLLESDSKFIRIGNEIIAKNQIQKVSIKQIGGIENFILSKPKDIQEILRTREKQKRANVGRGFDSIDEICNFLREKKIEA